LIIYNDKKNISTDYL